MAVTTQGSKQTIDPLMSVNDDEVHKDMVKSEDVETRDAKAKDGVSNEIVTPKKLKPIPRCPPLFP